MNRRSLITAIVGGFFIDPDASFLNPQDRQINLEWENAAWELIFFEKENAMFPVKLNQGFETPAMRQAFYESDGIHKTDIRVRNGYGEFDIIPKFIS